MPKRKTVIRSKNKIKKTKRVKRTKTKSKQKTEKKSKQKSKQNSKTFKKDRCAPKKGNQFSCYDNDALDILKQAWNRKHTNNLISETTPKQIWKQLKDKNASCERESCWLSQPFMNEHSEKSNISKKVFAPKYPTSWYKNKNEWLNSLDIERVMKQYENAFKTFKFIGPSPLDYDTKDYGDKCVWEELCMFNLRREKQNGVKKIGMIFNLDTHDKPGSHWVAMFIDNNKKHVYYFDSYGDEIPQRLVRLVNTIQVQGRQYGENYEYYYNDNRHQYKNSECGMYCLYFIITLLKGKSFDYFLNKKISDDEMLKKRKVFFNF